MVPSLPIKSVGFNRPKIELKEKKAKERVSNTRARVSNLPINFLPSFLKSRRRTKRTRLGTLFNSPIKLPQSLERILGISLTLEKV